MCEHSCLWTLCACLSTLCGHLCVCVCVRIICVRLCTCVVCVHVVFSSQLRKVITVCLFFPVNVFVLTITDFRLRWMYCRAFTLDFFWRACVGFQGALFLSKVSVFEAAILRRQALVSIRRLWREGVWRKNFGCTELWSISHAISLIPQNKLSTDGDVDCLFVNQTGCLYADRFLDCVFFRYFL